MITDNQTLIIGNLLGVNFNNFSLEDFKTGMNIELEHGKTNELTNVTNNNLLLTGKIALAHLNEFPDYYNKEYGLPFFENMLKEKNKKRI